MILHKKILVAGFMLYSMIISSGIKAQEANVIYEYNKYEKFNFEDISINAQTGAPGDLTSTFRFQSKFTNELPYRKNFDKEMIEAIDRVR